MKNCSCAQNKRERLLALNGARLLCCEGSKVYFPVCSSCLRPLLQPTMKWSRSKTYLATLHAPRSPRSSNIPQLTLREAWTRPGRANRSHGSSVRTISCRKRSNSSRILPQAQLTPLSTAIPLRRARRQAQPTFPGILCGPTVVRGSCHVSIYHIAFRLCPQSELVLLRPSLPLASTSDRARWAVCLTESDPALCRLCNELNYFAVLSNDSDFFVMQGAR